MRRTAISVVRAALHVRSRAFRFDEVSSALVFSPHQDDEAFGCGGTLALMARRPTALGLVFLTDGSGSHPNHPTVAPSELSRMRKNEARAAAAALGVPWEAMAFLDVRDGTLSHLDAGLSREFEGKIAALVTQARPAAIFLPGRRDGSTEHEAAFASIARALSRADQQPRIFEFPIWSWWNPSLLVGPLLSCRRIWHAEIGSVLNMKAQALAAYTSQTHPIAPQTSPALPPGFAAMFLGTREYFFEW